MKKILFAALTLLLFAATKTPSSACALDLSYAQMQGDATLYSLSPDGSYCAVCTLPSSYFVRVCGDEADGYYPVVYDELTGYILASAVQKADFEPVNKYANATLTLSNDGFSVNLRSSPNHDGDNIVAVLPSGETLKYYGKAVGSSQVAAVGNEWFFVRTPDGKTGYVYSLYALAQTIPENTVEAVVEPLPDPPVTDTPDLTTPSSGDADTPNGISDGGTREAIIVLALCAPVVIVVYLLFRRKA